MEDTTTLLPSSMWTSINNWCTPTFLFLFLNFMIATILFTSNLPNSSSNNNNNNQTKQQNQKTQTQNEANNNKLGRSPSILNRLRSFNLHAYRSPNDQQQQVQQEEQDALELAATQYVFDHPFPDPDPQPIPVSSKQPDLDPTHFAQTNVVQVQPPSKPIISNAQTHFVVDRHTIEKITTHYDFGPTHIENDPPEPTQFSFDPTHLDFDQKSIENKQEKKTHFKFDPTHLEKTLEKPTHIENEPENPTQDDFDPTHEEENDTIQSLDEVYSIITGGGEHMKRTKSDTVPASGEVPVKLPAKMKKSASMKSPFSHFEEEKIVEARRPETVRERRTAAVVDDGDDDVEVDAKADDFINKFKQQLKLQRLDSIIRYKDMVNKGGGK